MDVIQFINGAALLLTHQSATVAGMLWLRFHRVAGPLWMKKDEKMKIPTVLYHASLAENSRESCSPSQKCTRATWGQISVVPIRSCSLSTSVSHYVHSFEVSLAPTWHLSWARSLLLSKVKGRPLQGEDPTAQRVFVFQYSLPEVRGELDQSQSKGQTAAG